MSRRFFHKKSSQKWDKKLLVKATKKNQFSTFQPTRDWVDEWRLIAIQFSYPAARFIFADKIGFPAMASMDFTHGTAGQKDN